VIVFEIFDAFLQVVGDFGELLYGADVLHEDAVLEFFGRDFLLVFFWDVSIFHAFLFSLK
jgi:hypothetical protein